MVDMTKEFPYEKDEKHWIPLEPVHMRKPVKPNEKQKFAYSSHIYDRTKHDMGIFEKFMDQQVALMDLEPNDLAEHWAWKKEEEKHHDLSRDIILADFKTIQPTPYDVHNIVPQSYNLSIQYDRERRNEADKNEKNKRKEERKKAQEEKLAEKTEKGKAPEGAASDDDEKAVAAGVGKKEGQMGEMGEGYSEETLDINMLFA